MIRALTIASSHSSAARRRGLTFIELMFATMILGLGMIIIASVFPVAIGEQKATIDAAAASATERNAARTLDALVTTSPTGTPWLPDTIGNTVSTFGNNAADAKWLRIRGDLIDKADARYAWTAMYQRQSFAGNNDAVTFFIVTLASRETSQFDNSASGLDALFPADVMFDYVPTPGNDPDTVQITGPGAAAATEGAFLIRAAMVDPTNTLFPQYAIIKLGNELDATTHKYEVAPGFEMIGVTSPFTQAGFVVGRGMDSGGNYTGPNQAMSCRAVTIQVPDPG